CGEQRPDRADVGRADRIGIVERAVRNGADVRVVADPEDPQLAGFADLLGEADTAAAENAAFLVEHHSRTDRMTLEALPSRAGGPSVLASVAERVVLQIALASLIADRTIQRMIEKQKLHDAASGLGNLH